MVALVKFDVCFGYLLGHNEEFKKQIQFVNGRC